jgi:drug/metabolite transporter (DMT)-like permease
MPQLILSMTLWGTLGIFVLWSNLPAIDIAFYRCLIGTLFIGCWMFKSKQIIQLNKTTGIVALAGICLVLNWVFLFKSFQVSSITIGNMSYYLQPVMLIILGMFIYNEKVSLKKWILILFALSGTLLTIDLHNLHSSNILLGVLLALVAALLYSFLTLLMKNINLNYLKIIFIQLGIGTLILLPLVHLQRLSFLTITCLIVIGLVHTLLAYYLYYNAIKKTSFTQIAVLSYLDPIVAIITDVIFFNRHLSILQIVGIGLTFSALYLLITAERTIVSTESINSII